MQFILDKVRACTIRLANKHDDLASLSQMEFSPHFTASPIKSLVRNPRVGTHYISSKINCILKIGPLCPYIMYFGTYHKVRANRKLLTSFDFFQTKGCCHVHISGLVPHTPSHVNNLNKQIQKIKKQQCYIKESLSYISYWLLVVINKSTGVR